MSTESESKQVTENDKNHKLVNNFKKLANDQRENERNYEQFVQLIVELESQGEKDNELFLEQQHTLLLQMSCREEKLREQITQLTTQVETLEHELNQTRQQPSPKEGSEPYTKLAESKKEIDKLKHDKNALLAECENLKSQQEKLNHELQGLKKATKNSSHINHISNISDPLLEENKKLKLEVESLQSKLTTSQKFTSDVTPKSSTFYSTSIIIFAVSTAVSFGAGLLFPRIFSKKR